jgi:UDPglucose 6-dehydrogenase
MIGDIADRTPNASKDDICNALGLDQSIGSVCMRPGLPYGGPCYPRDNRALAHYAQVVGVRADIPLATDAYNEYHSNVIVETLLKSGQEQVPMRMTRSNS